MSLPLEEKQALRRKFRAVREKISRREEKNAALFRAVSESPQWRDAQSLLCYVSVGAEADTRALLSLALEQGKALFCPLCLPDKNMVFCRVENVDELLPGMMEIPEPSADGARYREENGTALCLTPGLAFDRRGFRLGYGGGYYDRFLAAAGPKLTAFGLAFGEQISSEFLPHDEHDIPLAGIFTENGVLFAPEKKEYHP